MKNLNNLILCNISGNELPKELNDDVQLVQTYTKILEIFEQVHFIGRTSNFNSCTIKHPTKQIFVHHVKVPNSKFGRTCIAVFRLYFTSISLKKKLKIKYFIASDPTIGGLTCTLLNIFNNIKFIQEIQAEMTRISPKIFGIYKAWGFKFITLLVCRFATKIRAVSNKVKEQLIEDGVNHKKIKVVTSRVNVEKFNLTLYPDANLELKNKFRMKEKENLFIFIGRLVPSKGISFLLTSLKHFKKQPYKLLIVGDGPLRESLKTKCVENNIQDKVIFCGAVDYHEVPYYIAAADLIIMPSTDEGFPRVMLEAMAMKKLVAASLVGGVLDIAKNEVNGYYFESQNPDAILETLNKIYSKDNICINQNMVENAYQEVIQNYSFEVVMEKYNQMFVEYISMLN